MFFHKKKMERDGCLKDVNWTQILNLPVSMTLTLIIAKKILFSRKVNLEHSLLSQKSYSLSVILKATSPTPGAQSLSLVIANLQLNGVPGLPQRSFCTVAFHCLNFVFQAGQSMPFNLTAAGVHPCLQQHRWQLLIFIKKHSKYILWLWSELGIRCAMRARQSKTGTQISEPCQSETEVHAKRPWLLITHHRAMFV